MLKSSVTAGSNAEPAPATFNTIDPSFFLNQSGRPPSIDPTHMYNGQPTAYTDLQRENQQLDPHRAAMLRRTNYLPNDGVLYEINDAPDEEEAVWSYKNLVTGYERHHLTYHEYQRMLFEEKRSILQNIQVKQHVANAGIDYTGSP
jgi:hypothetical protein